MTDTKTPQQLRDDSTAKRLGIRLEPKRLTYYARAVPIANPIAGATKQESK